MKVRPVGFMFVSGRAPIEDYIDFINAEWDFTEVEVMVNQGVIPPGMILVVDGGNPCVVVGQYEDQEIKKMSEFIKEQKHEKKIKPLQHRAWDAAG